MNAAFAGLLGSRKALVAMLAIIAVSALSAMGRVAGEQAVDFCKWVVMTLIGSQALVDAATNHGLLAKGSTTTTTTNVNTGTGEV